MELPGNQKRLYKDALAALGSSMSIGNTDIDAGWHSATSAQIATDPLMTGVSTFQYAYGSTVIGGTALLYGTTGDKLITYEGTSVSEPSTLVLLGSGLVELGFIRRRFKK